MDHTDTQVSNLQLLRSALDAGAVRSIQRTLESLHPSEIAHLLESLPVGERVIVWNLVDQDIEGDVLVDLTDAVRSDLIERMEDSELVAAAEGMEIDDLADLVSDLPERVSEQVIRDLDQTDRDRLQSVLSYPEDSAGGLMNPDTITVRSDVTLDVVIRYMRLQNDIPDSTDSLFVIDRNNCYLGVLRLSRLLINDPERSVAEVMDENVPAILVTAEDDDVARLFENRDLLSAAVVDEENRLLGRITVDDVVDVIREEAEHSIMSAAGLDEEDDMFAPVLVSAKRRAIWLGVNLLTAFLAAYVVDSFQVVLKEVVLLAVLMPIVPSMGGVSGTQSLTIITRALALGQIELSNAMSIFKKEISVALINGIAWAVVVSAVTYVWFDNIAIGAIIAAALMINMFVAAAAGFALPLLLKRMRIDPAIAGGVVLTTITDVVGYGAFLGLAALFLLQAA